MNPETYVSLKILKESKNKALKNGTEDILENDTILENLCILQSCYFIIIINKPALIFVFAMQVASRNWR